MNRNKIIIRAKLKSFTNIFYVLLGIFFLVTFFLLLREHFSSIFLACDLLLGFIFLFVPLGKKITISGNLLDYQNWFFFHHKIEISAETKIKMGMCYPKWGAQEFIWKISNHRGKEKIKIHAWYFDYKKVNAEFEKLAGYKIEFSLANIRF